MARNSFSFQERTFCWTINNFLMCPHLPGEPICSPKFSLEPDGFIDLSLYFYPRGDDKLAENEFVSLYLVRDTSDNGPEQVIIDFKLIISDSECIVIKDFRSYSARFEKGSGHGKRRFVPRQRLEKPDNSKPINDLRITCEFSAGDDNGETYSTWKPDYKDLENLSSDLCNALITGKHCDMYLKSSDKYVFTTHKAVVLSRFPSIIDSVGSYEDDKLVCNINGTSLHVLLKYLYSGKFDIGNDDTTNIDYDTLYNLKITHLKNLLFPIPSTKFASTTVSLKYGSFVWDIPAFKNLSRKEVLKNTFSFDESIAIIVSLRIKENDSQEDCVYLTLSTLPSKNPLFIRSRIFLFENKHEVKLTNHLQKGETWNMPPFIKMKTLDTLEEFQGGNLIISFKFQISDGKHHTEIDGSHYLERKEGQPKANFWALQDDFKRLYTESYLHDVNVHAGKVKFLAHRSILSARSSVLSKILEENIQKQAHLEDIVNIDLNDIGEQTVAGLLSYLYCGEVIEEPQNIDSALDLYGAADKLKIQLLKEKCKSYLSHELNAENIANVIMQVTNHGYESLTGLIKNFMYYNDFEILYSKEWKRMKSERVDMSQDMQNVSLVPKDMRSDILMTMLSYLYCGKVIEEKRDYDSVIKLYECSNNYKLLQMKKEYVSLLSQAINTENIGKVILLGNTYNDNSVQSCVRSFVNLNVDKIITSKEWERLMKNRIDLAEDMQNIVLHSKSLSPDIIFNMLSYIYCGKLFTDRKNIFPVAILYFETCVYKLPRLRTNFASLIRSLITAENVGKMSVIAHTSHKDEALKECILDFIRSSGDKILNSDSWRMSTKRLNLNADVEAVVAASQKMKPEMIMIVLTYMHSGVESHERKDKDFLMNLYLSACKYQLLQVKKSCVLCLKEIISPENAGKMLVIALRNKDDIFKQCVLTYIYSNREDILKLDSCRAKIVDKLGLDTYLEILTLSAMNIQIDVMETLLSYVYSEKLAEEKYDLDHIIKMYICADKHKLFQIKHDCNSFFEREISAKNIGKLLMLPEQYKDGKLLKCIQDFVSSNVDGILTSDEWKRNIRERFSIKDDLQDFSVDIKSLGPSAIVALLYYTCHEKINVEQIELDSVMELYTFATKHCSLGLKMECITLFTKLMKIENVGELIILSDKNDDNVLECCVQNFVSSYMEDILNSTHWKNLIKEHLDFPECLENISSAARHFGSEIVMHTLSYIFSRRLFKQEKNIDSLLKLYAISNEYRLLHLKCMCSINFKQLLTTKNIGRILVAAHTYDDEHLKIIAHDFVCSNAKELLNSNEWKDTLKDHPRIVSDTLMAVLATIASMPKGNS